MTFLDGYVDQALAQHMAAQLSCILDKPGDGQHLYFMRHFPVTAAWVYGREKRTTQITPMINEWECAWYPCLVSQVTTGDPWYDALSATTPPPLLDHVAALPEVALGAGT